MEAQTKRELFREVRDIIQAVAVEMIERAERVRLHDLVDATIARRPELFASLADTLGRQALVAMTAKELKAVALTKTDDGQVPLDFGVPGLPAMIAVPVSSRSLLGACEWVPLRSAKLSELEAHIAMLAAQIVSDRRKLRKMKTLRDLVLAYSANPDCTVEMAANAIACPAA